MKILIINGHPDKESYNFALAEAYEAGAKKSGAEVQTIHIRDLSFNPNLEFGYRKRTELEPDLLAAQEALKSAEHLVWVYPVWWGSYPAIMKGFLDRVSRIICTMDQPSWFYRLINRAPSHHSMKKLTMNFIGVKKVRITAIGPLRLSSVDFRQKWLNKVERLGEKIK